MHPPSADILPASDAEELIDFTCATPWERLVLDVELQLRDWDLSALPTEVSDPPAPPSHHSPAAPAPSATAALSLGARAFTLELHTAPDPSIHAVLGVGACVALGPAEPHGIAATDASDASTLLSALCAAAAAARCPLPMLVRVGPVAELRLIGRRGGAAAPRRYCCDYTSYPPAAHAHLPGMLALFHNKRVSARRVLPPSRADAVVSARYTYYWSDFAFKVAAEADSFAHDPLLAALQKPALVAADPVQYLVLTLLWPPFAASEVLDTAAAASDSHAQSLNAPVASMVPRNAATFRLSPPRDTFPSSDARSVSQLPLTSPVKSCFRLMHRASLASRPQRPAAARALIDIHRAATRSSLGDGNGAQGFPRLTEAQSAPLLQGSSRSTGSRIESGATSTASRRERWKNREAIDSPWASAGPPDGAMDDFVAQIGEYVAAAAVENDKLDEEFLFGAVISLFGSGPETGLVAEVVEALGPGVGDMSAVERISRLAAASGSTTIAQRLWGLFLDGIELHWEMGWSIRGVPYDPEVGPATDACLLVQKLEMLNCCLHRLHSVQESSNEATAPGAPVGRKRRLSVRCRKSAPAGDVCVDEGNDADDSNGVWEPVVQPMPYVTRDMTEAEQTKIVMNADKATDGSAHRCPSTVRQSTALRSDMMSFKAANPGAEMSDFVQWFSPVDWIEEHNAPSSGKNSPENDEGSKVDSNPAASSHNQVEASVSRRGSRSGRLSARMQTPGNLWQEIWNSVEAIPASKQVPLFDAHLHGLKALSDLRGYPLKEVLRQFACVQAMYSIRLLQRAYQLPPLLPSVNGSIMAARQTALDGQLITPDGDPEALAMIADICGKLSTAEQMALGASSLVTKLPPGSAFSDVIDALVSGKEVDVTSDRERHAIALVAGMEEGGWRTPMIPSYREFTLDGSDADRMNLKISSDMFRVGMTWGSYNGGMAL